MQSEIILSTKTKGARVRGTLSFFFFLVAILIFAAPTTEHANLVKSEQEPNGCRHLDRSPPGRPLILSRYQ